MIISFSGPSSSGKSTLLTECKKQWGNRYTYVEEITRKIKAKGLPINEAGSDITQLLIINSHLENSLLTNVVLDRCILDGLVYTQYLYLQGKISTGVMNYAGWIYSMLHDKYDVIFYTEPVELHDDGVRSTSHEFRNETIRLFDAAIKGDSILNKKIVRLNGSIEERMALIESTLKSLSK